VPPPLLVIAGPTASGKSRLGVEVAELLDGEVVSADAFAVYRGLDIGTDKPPPELRRRVPHYMIDVAEPTERFSAGRFAVEAAGAIDRIASRGRTAVVVGGTHFWIRALLVGLFPEPERDPDVRRRLAAEWEESPAAVFERLRAVDPASARRLGAADRQRILRALEVWELSGVALTEHWRRHREKPRFQALIAVPEHRRQGLHARIDLRVDAMFAAGLVTEVERILASGVPRDAHSLKAIGYRETVAYLDGTWDLDAAKEETKRASRRLAKRQLSWLRSLREAPVHWVPDASDGGAGRVVELWKHHTRGPR
jgi:tRNA dimethylallyltransferase